MAKGVIHWIDMSEFTNEYDLPVGFPLSDWVERPHPPRTPMLGRYCRLEPLDPAVHGRQLFSAYVSQRVDSDWTYLSYGPFESYADYAAWLESVYAGNDPLFHTIIDATTDKAVGLASYLRIVPRHGVIEVGHIHFSPLLQKTPAATEAMYLMMVRVFDELGYRRYEWKCDALNAPSRKAALRYGFSYEGTFRQAIVYKGRNRDTAWFSMLDTEWAVLKPRYEAWLSPDNFDADGRQRQRLGDI